MKKRLINPWLSSVTMLSILSCVQLQADESSKRSLLSNYQLLYHQDQKSVESINAMFQEGSFYGRLRSNTFSYTWENESATQNNHLISGLGGSLIFKSASHADLDFTTGLYFSKAYFDTNSDPVSILKAGKDVVSRFDYSNTGSASMSVLAEAYLRYSGFKNSTLSVGRQMVETFYTKSNDTKMIPNTFEGVVLDHTGLSGTKIRLAYLAKQKLRDHTQSHSVLAYGDANASTALKPAWNENDDSAMHKGLTYTKLTAAGVDTEAPLIVLDLHNKSIKNLKLDAAYYSVPELLSEAMIEANYKSTISDNFSITAGMRYIKQIDDGAGAIGGAAYDGDATGYKDPTSLESQMIAAKIVTKYQNYALNLGFSQIFDEADLITPWRGFPTAGYTRSMARYNWQANTKSYRILLKRNANAKGVFEKTYIETSVLHTDADESKGHFDETYYYLGFIQNIPSLRDLSWRLRLGYNDTEKVNADNLDARFELNYLF